MICPKCGFEQPDGVECMRCGVIVSRYKGPVAGAAAGNTPPPFAPGLPPPLPPPSFIPPPPVIAGGAVHAPLPPPPPLSPPPAGSGTVYGGQPGGPGSSAPAFSSFPVFHGTFETGAITSEVFSIYFANIIPFLLLATLALSPVLLFSAWEASLPAGDPMAVSGRLLTNLLQLFCTPIATAAITYGVYQQLRGASPSVGACLKVGLSTLVPLVGLAIVQGFGIGLASLACLVPGIILAVRWSVAIPAKVEEGVGVGDALSRSTFLTDGFRWQVFGVLFVIGAINIALTVVLILVFAAKTQSGGFALSAGLLSILTTGLSATAYAVMYYRLRSVKEAIDVDHISSVFA